MGSKYDMLQTHLKLIRAAQGAALKIVTEASQVKQTSSGKIIQKELGKQYWDAVSELKDLMSREQNILAQMNSIDPDLCFDANEKYSFNDRGEIIIE